MRISDWSSDVCSSDLRQAAGRRRPDARAAHCQHLRRQQALSLSDMQDTTPGDAARGFSFVLARRAGGLELQAPHHPGFKPIRCDWTDAEMSRRVAAGKQQLLARAIGLHKYKDLSVLDATAGLGRDGFVLAALGAQVTMVERQDRKSTRLNS